MTCMGSRGVPGAIVLPRDGRGVIDERNRLILADQLLCQRLVPRRVTAIIKGLVLQRMTVQSAVGVH